MVIFYCGFPLKIACGLLTTETIKEIARVRQFSNDDIFHIVYKIRFKAYRCESIYILFLKEVFAKNERGYRLTTNNKRFWSLLILLLLKIELNWKKRLIPKNAASTQIQKVAIINPDRKNNHFNSKQIIKILQPIIIDFFSDAFVYI